jgi:hypothetical protein
MPSFNEAKYPGIEQETIRIPKKIRPDWMPLTEEETRKRIPYRNSIKGHEFIESTAPKIVQDIFSYDTASQRELNSRYIQQQIERFQIKKGDTGTTPVQSKFII